ncbi:very short patch repair endonuclease [Streptomyces rubiginosohelvolus]|uniref:very short patch repair endonuclease n=1 Tax=Streptomyces rubiginosohelvolus TaxID=67362 RepID=UPI0035D78712
MSDAASERQRGWNGEMPPARAYKARAGMVRAARSAEQDRAAGGLHRRAVLLDGGRFARGSIALRLYRKTRRIRAYLRWSDAGQTNEKYVGDVAAATRAANLALAWEKARAAGLVSDEPLPPTSTASSVSARAVMTANKGRDTKPELALRSLLHGMGLRYRVDTRPLPGLRRTADVVFTKTKVAVFVDGCFWHGCPEHHRPAKRREEFWHEKIEGNRRRDAETNAALCAAGWEVIRVWEHEDPEDAAAHVREIVRSRHAV